MNRKIIRLFAALLLFVFLGCGSRTEDAEMDRYPGLSVESIVEDPGAFYDKEVIVSGEVDEVLNQKVITIGGAEYLGGKLLVVSRDPLPSVVNRPQYPRIREGDIIQIKGVVKKAPVAEIEGQYQFDLDQEDESELRDRPVLVAGQTTITGRTS